MARAFGMDVRPRIDDTGELSASTDLDVYAETEIGRIVDTWIPLCFALNSVNRCLGQSDLYPFVLSPAVIAKLGFMHRLVHGR